MLTAGERRPSRDRGSVLMLMPAAVLIVMVLGAIAVDLTAVRLGQRELIAAAGDAANDAVTIGLDEAALRAGEGYRIDAARAEGAVLDALAAKGILDDLAEAADGDRQRHRHRRGAPGPAGAPHLRQGPPGGRPTTSWCGRPSPPRVEQR